MALKCLCYGKVTDTLVQEMNSSALGQCIMADVIAEPTFTNAMLYIHIREWSSS